MCKSYQKIPKVYRFFQLFFNVFLHWFIYNLTYVAYLGWSTSQLHGLYEELQQCEDGERLVWHLENLVESVVLDACQQERERLEFDEAIRKEREQHQEHLKLLEDELELQVIRELCGLNDLHDII